MSNSSASSADSTQDDREHLASIDDGCGCVEVWEALSERRSESDERA